MKCPRPALPLLLAVVLVWLTGCTSSYESVAVVPRPATPDPNTVYVRGNQGRATVGSYRISDVDGAGIIEGSRPGIDYFIPLRAGWNKLSIEVADGYSSKGQINNWPVFLPGGRILVVNGDLKERSMQVWLEDEATGERVSEIISVALASED
jgi:hypothetical protein